MGSVNTTKLEERNGKIVHIGTNIDAKAIKNSLREALTGSASPFGPESPSTFAPGKAAALVIGGGGASRVSASAT
jgi:quinate dehydrogenase